MSISNSNLCIMPWIHLHVGNEGWVKACCVANIPYGNINEQSLDEIWNGEPIRKLRTKFLNGEIDNRCAVCHRTEAGGGISIRQETNEKYAHTLPQLNETAADGSIQHQPIYWDIRFSNVCNFRCRTCWHGASSRWFEDAKVLGNTAGEVPIIQNIKDLDAFLSKMDDSIDGLEELYFAGGEPLVTEEHYQLLELLLRKGLTNVILRYNTNFSQLHFKKYKLLELWSAFQSVELQLSIDGMGTLGELIRKEMKWSTIIRNSEYVKELSNLNTVLTPTVSVLNIMHLPELYMASVSSKMIPEGSLKFNMLDRPKYYNVQCIPEDKKTVIVEKYKGFLKGALLPNIRKEFQNVLAYMSHEDLSHQWPKFIQETKKLDQLRNEDTFSKLSF